MTGRAGVGLVWFRRDLRLSDNPALARALAAHDRVLALFVWDPRLVRPAGAPRLSFLRRCLEDLDGGLGGGLVVRQGDPARIVVGLAQEVGAETVWWAADYGPYGQERDQGVREALVRVGVKAMAASSPYAVSPGKLTTGQGHPYRVFTPFFRAWQAEGWEAPLARSRTAGRLLTGVASDRLAQAPRPAATLPPAGERAAHQRLDRFLERAAHGYAAGRDRPGEEGTSRLSPYLRFGCIHPRQILARLDPGDPGHRAFARELCFREFYADVLYRRPDSARRAYREEWWGFRADEGEVADERFEAWTQGRTGYPFVDAGMRQLQGEAWMHNRLRMVTASFLVKDLHLDWTRGARWFMSHLVDGDLAQNQHGWQWVAGTGTDPAPYFRVFNPLSQGQRFDPAGDYVRHWVPELAGVAGGEVHRPSAGGDSLFRGGYPGPIVDHGVERREALARYEAVRESTTARSRR